MTASLENRSALRKLEFPQSTQEALRRLYGTFSSFSGASTCLSLPPKETEIVLDVIDEFVFLNKPTKSRKAVATISNKSAALELRLMQVLIDFFISNYASEAEIVPLANLFNYIFMDPFTDVQGQSRTESLAKFSILALGLKCQAVLHCLGLWLQNTTQEKSKSLVVSLVEEYVLLIPDKPGENLKGIPQLSPTFAAHFMNAVTEFYSPLKSSVPKPLLELFSIWLEDSNPDKLLPLKGFMVRYGSQAMTWNNPTLVPLLGLAKWTILGPTLMTEHKETYLKLHLSLLECLAEICDNRKGILKTDLVPVNKLCSLVEIVQSGLTNVRDESTVLECLDRLGQFLLCLLSTKLIHGKMNDLCLCINKMQAYKTTSHRLLKMFISRAKNNNS